MSALIMDRRRSTWFGPQFGINNFSFSSFASPTNPSRRPNPKGPKLAMNRTQLSEPLFHDAYLGSEDELSPATPDPVFHTMWKAGFDSDYFGGPEETLADLGLAVDDDECNIVATFVSIKHAGKPKVIDIPPLSPPSREESPRRNAEMGSRPSIVWRMPSYEKSSSRSSQSTYTFSERTESLCSNSTSPSSISDECKIPDLIHCDPTTFSEPPSPPSTPSRAKSLRRHSRNLSASFSKAFLNRLKETEPVPPMPTAIPDVPPLPTAFLQSNFHSQHRGGVAKTTTLDPPMLKHDTYRSPQQPSTLKHAPALRRKKSIAALLY